ncbi:endo alpha-1,4 polygalactosaminidase [Paracoccus sp. p3-h83]
MLHVLLILLVLIALPARAAPSWDIQFSGPLDLSVPVQILDLDPDGVTADQIAALKARGVMPICYVSVGTVEDYRADRAAFPPQVLGKRYAEWPDEVFLDIRQRDVLLPLMTARLRRCAELGFLAVDPDNQDVHDNDTGLDVTAQDTLLWLRDLARIAHGMGLRIGQKNIGALTPDLVDTMDFVVTENCLTDGWCDQVAAYAEAGKPILAIEYGVAPQDRAAACARARAAGISMVFKTRVLSAGGAGCPSAKPP